MEDVFIKFKDKFIQEASNLLNNIEKALLDLEINPANRSLIQEIFRAMHTLKGVSSMYGFMAISELTHKLESIYSQIRDKDLYLTTEVADVTLKAIDHISNLLADENLEDKTNQENHKKIIEQTEESSKSLGDIIIGDFKVNQPQKKSSKKGFISFYIMLQPDEKLVFRSINITGIFQDLAKLGRFEIVKHQFSGFPGLESTSDNAWGIYLSTDAGIEAIEEVFIFIEDNIKILKIASCDIFDNEQLNLNIVDFSDEKDEINASFINEEIKEEGVKTAELKQDENEFYKNTKEKTSQIKEHEEVVKDLTHIRINQITANFDKKASSRISIDSEKLDQLMYLVSELVTTNAQLSLANKIKNHLQLGNAVEKIEKLSKQFRDNAINLRLIPIEDVVVRFQRLIRDLSHALNKEIKFVTEGTDTELDKSIIDQLTEPLMHLIRNCIDHGIEPSELRLKAGKPREGIIRVSAYYSGAYVYIKISDDGAGINHSKVFKKAVEKGFVNADVKLSTEEIYNLIFLPGFSTAESLTQVSGRGVGMDVVRKKIADIHGDVSIESEIGKGTTFTIKLQQTISIIDGLLIKADQTYFMIPLSEVEVCDQQAHSEIFRNQNNQIEFNKDLLPFIHLRSTFALDDHCPKVEKIIIISRNENRIAIVADTIIGEHQAVLKPLGKMFKKQEFLLGASILGDGNLALMLDTKKLAEEVFDLAGV